MDYAGIGLFPVTLLSIRVSILHLIEYPPLAIANAASPHTAPPDRQGDVRSGIC